jgi:RNA polymerase sigma-70 factor (ECF subfamily)
MTARLHLVTDADRDAERALASRASGGDQSAFEELYRAHSGRVYALCLRMSGSRQRAVELTQDVFVHLWERLGSWRGESALSSWIHRVTVNLVLSNVRSETRRQKHEVTEEPSPLPAEGRRELNRGDAAAENKLSRTSSVLDAIDLERAIAGLPPGARTVFVLHDVEGYKHDEIAKMTGTAEGTCRAQLHRARKLLMESLSR